MPVITALNQKGGVGKTSTCYHLAGTLAQAGRRVLLVDNDPQASLTQGFLGPQATRKLDPAETIAAVYQQEAIAGPGDPAHGRRGDRPPGRQPAPPPASTCRTRTLPTGRSRWPCATSWPTSATATTS